VKLLWQTEGQLHPLVIVHPGGYDLHIYSLLWQAVVPRCAKVFPQPGLHVEADQAVSVFISVYILSLAATENTLILLFGSKAADIFAKSITLHCKMYKTFPGGQQMTK
jgi:hypothetical protein